MATLTGHYAIDRLVVPPFFTPRSADNAHKTPRSTVLTQSDDHHSEAWICVGYVSKQTPLGQGIYCGFMRSELRPATSDEVRTALASDHLHGAAFRPHCSETAVATFHLLMSSAVSNWTTDKWDAAAPPIIPYRNDQLASAADRALQRHGEILERWEEITTQQITQILNSL